MRQLGRHVDLLTTKAFSWKLPGGPGIGRLMLAHSGERFTLQLSARQPGQLGRVVRRKSEWSASHRKGLAFSMMISESMPWSDSRHLPDQVSLRWMISGLAFSE